MERTKSKEANLKIGFFSRSYAFNRHKRLSAYSTMMPEAKLILFTTNKLKDIKKWNGIKTLEIIELKPTIIGYLKLINYCKKNKVKYLSNLGHPKSLPIILINKLLNKTKYIIFRGLLKNNLWDCLPFANFADKIMVNDVLLYKKLKKSPHKDKVYYLPAPTDTSFYILKDKKEMRKKLGLPLNKKIVIFVGRVNENKGSEYLLEAIKSNKDILFIVIGSISDERFKSLKSPNYLYLGKKDGKELVEYYGAADIGFFIIKIEGGGLAMTSHECLSCGRPIIISKRKDYMGGKGVIFPTKESPESVNKTLRDFFKTKIRNSKELEKKCRDFAINTCSIEKFTKNYRRLFLDRE